MRKSVFLKGIATFGWVIVLSVIPAQADWQTDTQTRLEHHSEKANQ